MKIFIASLLAVLAVATNSVRAQPTITIQPTNLTVAINTEAKFSVVASPLPLTYQWYFNGEALTDGAGISGSQLPNLDIIGVTPNNAGTYFVSVANFSGFAISTNVVLTILPPPAIGLPRSTGAGF